GLASIEQDDGEVRIGPLVTIRELETSALVRERLPLLWEAAHQFASLQVRDAATIGGNICRASPSGETLAPLLVLEATAKLAFPDGEKVHAVTGKANPDTTTRQDAGPATRDSGGPFFQGPGKTVLGSGGLLTEIRVPYPAGASRGVYLKHAVRGAMDIAMVGVAVQLTPDAAGRSVEEARIGLSAVAPTPIRASKAEALLRGKPITAGLSREAAAMAASDASPITDQRASAEYRTWIVEALTLKGLEQSWMAAAGKEALV
ncbi:MAG: FAD binding domain-containing protein, partial [Chloroflexota bacterium]|nr:FAD binding domain-containing protein [Chloroflexota bacterium]